MKAIMISIKPRYLVKILNGEKTLEIRTKLPKCDLPIDVYIYCTKQDANYYIKNKIYNSMINGKVVAKFTLNEIKTVYTIHFPFEYFYKATDLTKEQLEQKSCLSQVELDGYLRKRKGYAWQIDNLEIFDKPKEISEFRKCGFYVWAVDARGEIDRRIEQIYLIKKPPQSWCYIEI